MLSTEKVQTLISDVIDEAWDSEKSIDNEFESYMKVGSMSRGEMTNYQVAGFGMPSEREVLEDIDYDEPLFGAKQTIVPLNWGKGFRVAKETIEDIRDGGIADGANVDRLTTFSGYTANLKKKCFERVDLECALKWVNGTATTARYVGRDSLALFSASHVTLDNPPITQTNITTGSAMTATNIFNAINSLDTQRDDRGGFISTGKKYRLVYGPSNRRNAIEVLKTEKEVGTANNTVNALTKAGWDIEPVMVKNFDRANGNASYTGWFVQAVDAHEVHWVWRLKPEFDKNVDFDAVAVKYMVRFRGRTYHKDWRGAVGFPPT